MNATIRIYQNIQNRVYSLLTLPLSYFKNIRNTIDDNIDNSNNDIEDLDDDIEDGIEHIVKVEITDNVPDAIEIPIPKKNDIKPIQRLLSHEMEVLKSRINIPYLIYLTPGTWWALIRKWAFI